MRAESTDRMTTRDITHPWGRSDEFRRVSQPSVPVTFIRSNAVLFYSLGAASLLEALAPKCADRAKSVFANEPDFCDWMRTAWAPRRIARMRRLREYLALTWPEFDSGAACDRFLQVTEAQKSAPPASRAREALARCAAASQSALFYRCLASWAEDVRLRALAGEMAREDESAFARFRTNYETAARIERLGAWTSWRSASARIREARDVYVGSAFNALVAQWGPNAPFAPMAYAELVARVSAMVLRYGCLGWTERVVLRPWTRPPATRSVDSKPRAKTWFKPVFAPRRERSMHSLSPWSDSRRSY